MLVDEERGFIGCHEILSGNGIEVIIAAKSDHVGIAERSVRVVKNRVRCIISELNWKLPLLWTIIRSL